MRRGAHMAPWPDDLVRNCLRLDINTVDHFEAQRRQHPLLGRLLQKLQQVHLRLRVDNHQLVHIAHNHMAVVFAQTAHQIVEQSPTLDVKILVRITRDADDAAPLRQFCRPNISP